MFLSQKSLNGPPCKDAERGRPGSVRTRPAPLTALWWRPRPRWRT